MHPVIDELQKAAEYGPNDRRLSLSRPVLEGREDGQNGNAAKNDEDDFRTCSTSSEISSRGLKAGTRFNGIPRRRRPLKTLF
jgi:hypothetical protein